MLFRPKYDGEYLHEKIKNLIGGRKLSQTLTNVVIPAFDIHEFQPVIFSSLQVILIFFFLFSVYLFFFFLLNFLH